jgi:iterative type I PKS product template protein
MGSVLSVFAPPLSSEIKKLRKNDEALYLGSAKANIGHGEAASGVSSLIKVLLMMQHNIIVPHCGIKTRINRRFPTDLEERNVRIAKQPTPWPRKGAQSRKVFVNNFSAAGGNTALLIEDAPLRPDTTGVADPRSVHVIAVSAKAATSLHGNLRSLLEFLQVNQNIPIGQLSYTTTARRIHHQFRAMITGKDVGELCKGIEKALGDKTGTTRRKMASKVVFTFTGQGAQYPGMGQDFFEHFPIFRAEILHLDYIGRGLGFPSIVPVIQSQEEKIEAYSPTAVQLASVCMQLALSKLWAAWNVTPVAVLGHSLGEYAALSVAGVLSEAETIYAVGTRAELLQEMCTKDTHSMLVVRASLEAIEKVLEGRDYEISCINSPVETVLSGLKDGMASTKELLQSVGVKSTLLRVPYAFHSSQVEQIMPAFEKKMRGITFSKPRIPVLRALDGKIDQEAVFDSKYLAAHARQPVNMLDTLKTAHENHLITQQTITIEIGPHPAVSGMVSATLGSEVMCLPSVQRFRSAWHTTTSALSSLYHAGLDINWAAYQRGFPASEKVIALPAYSWSLKDYWIQYVNDWSLRKGDPPLTSTKINIESTTIHRIVEETASAHGLRLIVEADIARKDLRPLVQGHEVDGVPLCTPSVYADISLTIGAYLLRQDRLSSKGMVVDVSDMLVSKALILQNKESPQLLQAHTDVNWADQAASIRFLSFDVCVPGFPQISNAELTRTQKNQKLQEHSRCVVRFKQNGVQEQLQNKSKTTKKLMQTLREGIVLGATARFNRPMAYRMIRPLARFHEDYRAIDEIILNSDTLEASSRLSFASVKRGGDFHTHPAIIDALTQSCGFAMNCNDSTDLDEQVYMNHGWGNFSLFEPMDFEKVYTTYTRMEQGANKLWHGDVTVFDGDRVVAFFGQIAVSGLLPHPLTLFYTC